MGVKQYAYRVRYFLDYWADPQNSNFKNGAITGAVGGLLLTAYASIACHKPNHDHHSLEGIITTAIAFTVPLTLVMGGAFEAEKRGRQLISISKKYIQSKYF